MTKILGIAGSLRQGSYNKMLLKTAVSVAPEGIEIGIFDIKDIPLYNQDLESQFPVAVTELKNKIKGSDAVLFVTPEYNFSIPGVLKNAIDWVSRPMGDNSWTGKTAGVIGASMGGFGTIRGQAQLRQCLSTMNMLIMGQPEYFLSSAQTKFNDQGVLINEEDKERLGKYMLALAEWTKRVKG
jgi:chromate reductase, NAD(P)H dehydrogenase (quinone)